MSPSSGDRSIYRPEFDEKHRPTAEYTGLDEDAQSFKVGVFPDFEQLALNLRHSARLQKL